MKSKLELLISLENKMFNNKLSQAIEKLDSGTSKMKSKLSGLKAYWATTFSSGGTRLARYFSDAFRQIPFSNLLTNPITVMLAGAYKLRSYLKQSLTDYRAVSQEENKLAQIMQNTMNATKAQTNQVKRLILEQEKIGVVGSTAQTAGVQELSTYLTQKQSIEKLLPVMNDMLAQQYGLNASSEQAINIGSMLGKVMDGQTGALSRYGYKFDEVQENILKTGSEAQRVSVLFDVVSSSIGGVNKALANTPEGKMVQLANETSSVRAGFGSLAALFQTAFVPLYDNINEILAKITQKVELHKVAIFEAFQWLASAIRGVINVLLTVIKPVIGFFVSWFNAIKEGNPLISAFTAVLAGLVTGILAYQLVVNGIILVTKLWAVAQGILNVLMSANPIGLIIAGVAGLIALVVVIIKKWHQWGAALATFLGPLGLVISIFKSLYTHWESIKKAFKTDGILGGLKRIGLVLLDALLKPVQSLLEMLSKIPGLGKLAAKGADKIKNIRSKLDLVTDNEKLSVTTKPTPQQTEEKNLYGDENPTLETPNYSPDVGKDISSTVGAANQVKSVTINIDSFVKDGINLAKSDFQGMTKNEVENFFKELFLRVIAQTN